MAEQLKTGQFKFPGVPKVFKNRAAAAAFLRSSPKYAAKHAYTLKKRYPKAFEAAGYSLKTDMKGNVTVYHKSERGTDPTSRAGRGGPGGQGPSQNKPREVGSFKLDPKNPTAPPKGLTTEEKKVLAPRPGEKNYVKPKPPAGTGGKGGGAGGGTGGAGGGTGGAADDTAAAGSDNAGLFNALAGVDPNTGSPITRQMIDAIVNGQYNPKMNETRREIGKNPAQLETNLKSIDRWYGDVFKGVDTAKTRGADMTKSVAAASVDNAKAILGSIGGEAALGAQGVAQSGANAAGTIQALGANDQTFLNDIMPLLQGEAANAKTGEISRMGNQLQGYKQQLADLAVQKGGARGEGIVGAIASNNALDQTRFGNKVGLIQTAGALALDNAKAQDYLTDQQAAAEKANGTDNKTIMSKLAKASDTVWTRLLAPEDYWAQGTADAKWRKGAIAPSELVQNVLQTYRSLGIPMSDPRARSSAANSIQQYGYQVDPKWMAGWR